MLFSYKIKIEGKSDCEVREGLSTAFSRADTTQIQIMPPQDIGAAPVINTDNPILAARYLALHFGREVTLVAATSGQNSKTVRAWTNIIAPAFTANRISRSDAIAFTRVSEGIRNSTIQKPQCVG